MYLTLTVQIQHEVGNKITKKVWLKLIDIFLLFTF